MSRTYFNGVSQISYNGYLLSFALDDVSHKATIGSEKTVVVELISELETIEGVCNYILAEIEKIRKISQSSKPDTESETTVPIDDIDTASKLGPKLTILRKEHGTD